MALVPFLPASLITFAGLFAHFRVVSLVLGHVRTVSRNMTHLLHYGWASRRFYRWNLINRKFNGFTFESLLATYSASERVRSDFTLDCTEMFCALLFHHIRGVTYQLYSHNVVNDLWVNIREKYTTSDARIT